MSNLVGQHALTTVRRYYPAVTKIVDATSPVDIQVIAEDCRKGNKKAPSACAMARAAMRSFDGAIIARSRAYLIRGKKAMRYVVPQNAAYQIVSFDKNQYFAPGEYTLMPPPKSMRLNRVRPFQSTSHAPKATKTRTKDYAHTHNMRVL